MKNRINISGKRKYLFIGLLICILFFWFCLPDRLFDNPYSLVVYDAEDQLLGARIALDGQWRFPEPDSIPKKFEQAILHFEDKRFYLHPGVDPVSILRAIKQNAANGKVVSGASTITMQLMRMSRDGQDRNVYQKSIESIMALRTELRYSKQEILKLYAAHAPFGGNIVGIEAACWRYFEKSPEKLSWGEAALLAVLPNAPNIMHPGKNRSELRAKRNRLLKSMLLEGIISKTDYMLATEEPIPDKPSPLPSYAYHLVEQCNGRQEKVATTIRKDYQQVAHRIAKDHSRRNAENDINNLAILISDTQSGEVLAYIGNSELRDANSRVDMIKAERSSGSILKPFLHASMIQEGLMMPESLLPDIPLYYKGFSPRNYNKSYDGAVSASAALYRSLNIPAVHNLQRYGVYKFWDRLKKLEFSSLHYNADHYGLSLILGGAEVTLWDLCGNYAAMGRTLYDYNRNDGKYNREIATHLRYEKTVEEKKQLWSEFPTYFTASCIWETFDAMTQLKRPDEEGAWQSFVSDTKIAWKTGTSYGHRDAWAVGVSPKYTIGVWVGNADGEGRNGIIGVKVAGSLLFDVLNSLPYNAEWFVKPLDDMIELSVCKKSGHIANIYCNEKSTGLYPASCERSEPCSYHKKIHLDSTGKLQINKLCAGAETTTRASWFELPPTMAHYYRKVDPTYQDVPAFRKDCIQEATDLPLAFIYPGSRETVYLPTDIDDEQQKIIFKASHNEPDSEIFWHVNDTYQGVTTDFHSIAISLEPGSHQLSIIDKNGNRADQYLTVVDDGKRE